VLIGFPTNDYPEWLYFDAETGLLLKKRSVVPTGVGSSPFEVTYSDYRDTGSGVKIPFLIHMSPAGPRTELATQSTIRIWKVRDNISIASSRFAKPSNLSSIPSAVPPRQSTSVRASR